MQERLRSLDELMPFATAGELIAEKRRPVVSVSPDATALAALTLSLPEQLLRMRA